MHINTVNIHLGGGLPASLMAILAAAHDPAPAPAAEAARPTTAAPRVGEAWPGQGGVYAGIARGVDGAPDQHLILAAEKPTSKLAWQAALDWAKGLQVDGHADFTVPTRFESALLYANLRDQVETSGWHWTSTQLDEGGAWDQYFLSGNQGYGGKKYEASVRAVRRFNA